MTRIAGLGLRPAVVATRIDATTNRRRKPMKRLLVVDDALFMRKLICGVAAEAGWEVVGEAGNGVGGRRALRAAPARPGDDGPGDAGDGGPGGPPARSGESIRRPRSSWSRHSIRNRRSMDSIRDGAIDFIVKPFERQRVLNLLAKLEAAHGASVNLGHLSVRRRGHGGDTLASQPDRRGPSWRSDRSRAWSELGRPGARPDRGRLGVDAPAPRGPARIVAGDRGRRHRRATAARRCSRRVRLKPDVITLDVEMPEVSGLEALPALLAVHEVPVIMVSALTQEGADVTLQALELGAVDFMPKPERNQLAEMRASRDLLVGKVLAAAQSRVRRPRRASASPPAPPSTSAASPDDPTRRAATATARRSSGRRPPAAPASAHGSPASSSASRPAARRRSARSSRSWRRPCRRSWSSSTCWPSSPASFAERLDRYTPPDDQGRRPTRATMRCPIRS